MSKKKTVSGAVLKQSILLIFIMAIPLSGLLLIPPIIDFQQHIDEYQNEYIIEAKKDTKNQIEQAINRLAFDYQQINTRMKSMLREQVSIAHAIASEIYEQNKSSVSGEKLQSIVRETLRKIRYNNGRGYFFATGLDGIEQLFTDRPELEGKNLLEIQDSNGKYVIRDMIEIAKSKAGEGFYSYTWSKPGAEGKKFPKLSYIKYFKPFDWFIGTGEYLDVVETEIKAEAIKWLDHVKYGKDNYLFAFEYGGTYVAHVGQNVDQISDNNYWDIKDVNGVLINQELQRVAKQGGGFVEYVWHKPSTGKATRKLAYAEAFKPWGWVIGTGIYLDDIESAIEAKQTILWETTKRNLLLIGIVLIVALCLAFFIAMFFSRHLSKEFATFQRFFKKAIKGSGKIEVEFLRYDGFQNLARAGNQILEDLDKAEVQSLAMIEANPDFLFRINKNNRFTFIHTKNPEELLVSKDMAIGKTCAELLPPDLAKQTEEKIASVMQTGQVEEYNYSVDYNGKTSYYEARMVPCGSDEIMAIVRDITKDKQAEKMLLQQHQQAKLAIEGGNLGWWDWNIPSGDEIYNEILPELLGYKLNEIKPHISWWEDKIHPDDLKQVHKDLEDHFEGKTGFYENKHRLLNKTGQWIWFADHGQVVERDSDGKPLRMLGTLRNIDEQYRAHEALRESEATIRNKLKAITEPDGDIGTLELSDIVDVDMLKSIMEEFYQLTGMLGALLDLSGNVLVAVGWQDICVKFHRVHPETCKNCLESDTILSSGVPFGNSKVYKCKNNLWDMVTPLYVGGRHVGNVFIGQFFYEDEVPDTELFRDQARKYGFDEEAYIEALEQVPRFSHDKVDRCMQFYSKLASIISTLSYSTIQQSRMLTDAKIKDQELEKAHERIRLANESAKLGIWDLDLISNHLTWDDRMFQLYGISPDEFTGAYEAWQKGVHPDDVERASLEVEKAISSGEPFNSEFRVVWPDGQVRHIKASATVNHDESGHAVRMTGINFDITEMKRAEIALRESEAKFKALTEYSVDTIMRFDREHRHLYVNPAVEAQTGLKPEAFIGKTHKELGFPENLVKQWDEAIDHVIDQAETHRIEFTLPNGSHIDWWLTPEFSNDGKVVAVITSARDITERKRTEEELVYEKELAQQYLNVAGVMLIAIDLNHNVTLINPIGCKILGYSQDEIIGHNWFDEFLQVDDVQTVKSIFDKTVAGDVAPVEYYENPVKRKDGSLRLIAWHNSFLTDKNGEIIGTFSSGEDITERKRVEEEILKFRTIADKAVHGSAIVELDGTIVYVNDYFARTHGYTADELAGSNLSIFHTDKQLEEVTHINERLAKNGNYSAQEIWHVHKDGTEFPMLMSAVVIEDGHGKPIYLAATAIDITEMKHIEEALKQSEKSYRDLMSNLNAGVVVHGPDTSVLFANPTACDLLGLSEDQMKGKEAIDPQWKFIRQDESDMQLEEYPVNQVISTKAPIHNQIIGINRNQYENLVWVLGNGFPVINKSGEIEQIIINFVDYTDVWNSEKTKNQLESQLQQAQKMESVGRLAGGVAHDFNNLLTGITGNIQLAQMDLSSDDPIYETLGEINGAADRAADLTRQLLAFSRKQIIEPKVINLNDLIKNMYKMLGRIIGEDIEIKFTPTKLLGQIKADPGQVEQIITNLSVNARDAMPNGGKLTIETTDVSLDEEYCNLHPHVKQGEYVRLAISDNGEGMNEETQKNIFDPFFTTKAEGQGTGLGLATVYGIVKQHDGHIEVYSEIGEGTTFKIYFPLVREKAEAITRTSPLKDLPQGTETVFIVEDESMVRNIAIKILTRLGYKVMSADDGIHALSDIKKSAIHIDLLLTDIIMPKMNGRELAEELQKEYPEIKVLFSSGYTEDVIAHHGVLEEGLNFIGKPYTPQTLAKKVREVLDA